MKEEEKIELFDLHRDYVKGEKFKFRDFVFECVKPHIEWSCLPCVFYIGSTTCRMMRCHPQKRKDNRFVAFVLEDAFINLLKKSKIGAVINYRGIKLRVREGIVCSKCAFLHMNCNGEVCDKDSRLDGKNVIFEKLND